MLACGLLALAGACASDEATGETERHASAWEQVIRGVALADVPPRTDDEPLPVVFAHELGDDQVPAAVQVEVVNALLDDADVRFTDEADGVIDDGADDQPVEDDGVLITMEPPPESGDRALLEVIRYRAASDIATLEVALSGGSPAWAVESVTQVG